MNRAFTNILSAHVGVTAGFYEDLLGMNRHFDSDWFVILTHPRMTGFEFGILSRSNDIVPAQAAQPPAGVILTFVVEDVEAVFQAAQRLPDSVLQPPTDMPYGQRRLLLKDPDGTVVDISAPIPA